MQTWKKWLILRLCHLAYFKTTAEYELLLCLLDLNEVHSVMPVSLKQHRNMIGLVLPMHTFYLQAETGTGAGVGQGTQQGLQALS